MYYYNVFPLREAYKFAAEKGGEIGDKANTIRERGSIPEELIDKKYGGTSQARRALIYLLFMKYEIFEEFENKCWPGNHGKAEILEELQNDYIKSGLLTRYKDLLSSKLYDLL